MEETISILYSWTSLFITWSYTNSNKKPTKNFIVLIFVSMNSNNWKDYGIKTYKYMHFYSLENSNNGWKRYILFLVVLIILSYDSFDITSLSHRLEERSQMHPVSLGLRGGVLLSHPNSLPHKYIFSQEMSSNTTFFCLFYICVNIFF